MRTTIFLALFSAFLSTSCLTKKSNFADTPEASLDSDPTESLPGLLDGAFVYFGDRTATRYPLDKIDAMLDEFVELRMHTLILAGIRMIHGKCAEGNFSWGLDFPDKLGPVLDGAAKRGMDVYISVTSSADTCNAAERLLHYKKIAADAKLTAGEIHKRWGTHPAFKGWYIPDEPGVPQPTHFHFYKAMSNSIRAHSELPILTAPYLATSTKVLAPGAVAALAKSFFNATKDSKGRPIIQVWQDSVGATGVDLNWGRGDPGLVEDYFKAIAQAIGKENVWADIEVFNCCVPPFGGGAYAGSSVVRLNNQLWATRPLYATKRVSWLPQIHMGEVDPLRYQDALRLKTAYMALYDFKGHYLKPVGYQWLTPPAPEYPDSGNELINMSTADPRRIKHTGWVGVNGNAKLVVDLGGEKKVNFVGVHLLNDPKPAIKVPQEIQLKCMDDSKNVTAEHKEPRGFEPGDSTFEYVLSNFKPLAWTCRYVEVGLTNGVWTFMSELEITSP